MRIVHTLRTLSLLTAIVYSTLGTAQPNTPTWTLKGFDQPESVVGDEQFLYVSNINGTPMEANGEGYISKITSSGQWIKQRWAAGMDAPKGMAIHEGYLYVADLSRLHKIDLRNGKTVAQWHAPAAQMLNDVTVSPEGIVYVSDLLAGGLYRLVDGEFSLWKSYAEIEHPNGIFWEDNQLIIGNWGQGLNDDFSTHSPGTLYRLNLANETLAPFHDGMPLGNIDGITRINDTIWISDWLAGDLMKSDGSNKQHLGQGLADIGSVGNILYAPMMMDGTVNAWQP